MSNGIVIPAYDKALIQKAHGLGLAVSVTEELAISFDRTLLLGPGATVPWELLAAAWHFLERWEAAAPLWRYGVLAADVGTKVEQERTRALTFDLRLPLYASELLFLRQCDAAQALLDSWQAEQAGGAEPRLAFLRALHQTKPLFLALPRSWLKEGAGKPEAPRRPVGGMTKLVNVEIAPGRYVCCRPEEVEEYRQRFESYRVTAGRRC
jgi:hypothetical protein